MHEQELGQGKPVSKGKGREKTRRSGSSFCGQRPPWREHTGGRPSKNRITRRLSAGSLYTGVPYYLYGKHVDTIAGCLLLSKHASPHDGQGQQLRPFFGFCPVSVPVQNRDFSGKSMGFPPPNPSGRASDGMSGCCQGTGANNGLDRSPRDTAVGAASICRRWAVSTPLPGTVPKAAAPSAARRLPPPVGWGPRLPAKGGDIPVPPWQAAQTGRLYPPSWRRDGERDKTKTGRP